MKRKIKPGDVFVDSDGNMRIIGKGDYVKIGRFTTCFLMTRRAQYSFQTNRNHISEHYLGNAITGKWEKG